MVTIYMTKSYLMTKMTNSCQIKYEKYEWLNYIFHTTNYF